MDSSATPGMRPEVTQPAKANRLALAVVTTIFFMWGFLTCLNDILIPHLKSVFELDWVRAMLIQFTFFGAYFLMSLPAGRLVGALGYKKGIVAGLGIAGAGALLFWPAAASRPAAGVPSGASRYSKIPAAFSSTAMRSRICWASLIDFT